MLLSLSSVTNLSLLFGFCAACMLSYRCLQMEWWAAITVVAIPSQPALLMWPCVSAARQKERECESESESENQARRKRERERERERKREREIKRESERQRERKRKKERKRKRKRQRKREREIEKGGERERGKRKRLEVGGSAERKSIAMGQWKKPYSKQGLPEKISSHVPIAMTLFTNCHGTATLHRSGPPPRQETFSKNTSCRILWNIHARGFLWEIFVFLEGSWPVKRCGPITICEEGHCDGKMRWDPVR